MSDSPHARLALTNHGDLNGPSKTCYYVSEAAEPRKAFTEAGYNVVLTSLSVVVPFLLADALTN